MIGAMKAGTTWFDDMLRASTDARLPTATKESFFLDRHHGRGVAWYEDQFPIRQPHDVRVEVASSYYASGEAADRLADLAPDASVAVVLREPGARSWSHYRHLVRKGVVHPTTTFEQAIAQDHGLLRLSRYDELLQPWRDRFGDAMVVMQFEQMVLDPMAFAVTTCSRIGLACRPGDVPVATRNQARAPRSHLLSRVAAATSERLHDHGLHGVVARAKRLGIERLVERRPTPSGDRSSSQERARAAVRDDTNRLRRWAGGEVDFDLWG